MVSIVTGKRASELNDQLAAGYKNCTNSNRFNDLFCKFHTDWLAFIYLYNMIK